MKFIVALLCLLMLSACGHFRAGAPGHYVHFPKPGGWNADRTQYENERVLLVNETAYCKGRAGEGALPAAECADWIDASFHRGVVDRNEAKMLALPMLGFLYDMRSTAMFGTKWKQTGCSEIGSLGLIGAHPGPVALFAYNALRLGVLATPALLTPLSKSTAAATAPLFAWKLSNSIRAGRHNFSVGCGG